MKSLFLILRYDADALELSIDIIVEFIKVQNVDESYI